MSAQNLSAEHDIVGRKKDNHMITVFHHQFCCYKYVKVMFLNLEVVFTLILVTQCKYTSFSAFEPKLIIPTKIGIHTPEMDDLAWKLCHNSVT
jgi:hypothetical protein